MGVLRIFQPRESYFYSIHSGSELDLFFIHDGKRIGVEFKRVDAPKATRSMRIAMEDLKLDELYIVYPGEINYVLSNRIQALSIKNLRSVL